MTVNTLFIYMKTIHINCFVCKKDIFKNKKEYNRSIKKGNTKFYCSKKCIQLDNPKRHKSIIKKCLYCEETFVSTTSKNSRKCCSIKCARRYSQKHVDFELLKRKTKENWSKGVYNKNRKDFRCKRCGELECKRQDVCKKYRLYPSLIKYFGFDESKIGTVYLYEEFDRIRDMIIEDYYDKLLSVPELVKKYGYYQNANFTKILDSLGIKRRSVSDALSNAYFVGVVTPKSNTIYKNGWHTTWEGKQVFYRSSYELDYCKELDEKKISYEIEKLRILYWDSQLNKQRVAIPDFYLPDTNEIVEIKSDWTYNPQNMIDKKKSYDVHGYNFKLILEHKEITI